MGDYNQVDKRYKQFEIKLVKGSILNSNEEASEAFSLAANIWSSLLSETNVDTSITISVDLNDKLPRGVIGSTHSVNLISNCASSDGGIIPSPLSTITGHRYPECSNMKFDLPPGVRFNNKLMITKANLKAVGFNGLDQIFGESDGSIVFNPGFVFDYNLKNGLDRYKTDFLSVAIHELGHLLGYISGVDILDSARPSEYYYPSILDISRFDSVPTSYTSSEREATPQHPNHIMYSDSLARSPSLPRFSRGYRTGNGFQASHWEPDEETGVYLGIMDPSLGPGQYMRHTNFDLVAFQELGYKVNSHATPLILHAEFLSRGVYKIWAHLLFSNSIKCKFDNLILDATVSNSSSVIQCRTQESYEQLSVSNDGVNWSNIVSL